ncbi:hypothetical protein [Roseobacter fucihabitans]|uniref:hypothetical protein n=1 Tax=Roseobacter fucihabitans TaxID=1537242 RepID=UPI001CA32BDE|nr:hypothetical protein [Roseobacter litoralis]
MRFDAHAVVTPLRDQSFGLGITRQPFNIRIHHRAFITLKSFCVGIFAVLCHKSSLAEHCYFCKLGAGPDRSSFSRLTARTQASLA